MTVILTGCIKYGIIPLSIGGLVKFINNTFFSNWKVFYYNKGAIYAII